MTTTTYVILALMLRFLPSSLVVVALLVSVSGSVCIAAPRREKPEAKSDAKADAEAERLELAREHFLRGEQLSSAGELHGALLEFELAELAHPSPSVTEAKRRVRDRLDQVPAPVVTVTTVTSRGRTPLRRFIAPIVLAPIALGSLFAGAALLGTVRHDVDQLQQTCAPSCAPSSSDALRVREPLAYALIGVGGALVVIDAVLWGVLARRKERPSASASLRPLLGATTDSALIGLRGRF